MTKRRGRHEEQCRGGMRRGSSPGRRVLLQTPLTQAVAGETGAAEEGVSSSARVCEAGDERSWETWEPGRSRD